MITIRQFHYKLLRRGSGNEPRTTFDKMLFCSVDLLQLQVRDTGHAGACATGQVETADAKNLALKNVGVRVPASFEDFGVILNELYVELVKKDVIAIRVEPPVPSIPVDYDQWVNKLGLILWTGDLHVSTPTFSAKPCQAR